MLSELFKGDPKLEACLVHDASHILQGAVGNHVAKIQTALFVVDGLAVVDSEISAKRYGPSTASAVLAFKKKRSIINRTYQTQEDNIVGKMTIAALDKEVLNMQGPAMGGKPSYCGNDFKGVALARVSSAAPSASTQLQFVALPVNAPVSPVSPKDVALTHVPGARTVVGRTRGLLAEQTSHRRPISFSILQRSCTGRIRLRLLSARRYPEYRKWQRLPTACTSTRDS